MTPYQLEQIEILRRIAERGKGFAERKGNEEFVDLFVHLIDEIDRLRCDGGESDENVGYIEPTYYTKRQQ